MLLDDAGEPLAADRADAAAAFLHREQQRHLIKRGPELAEAELCAGLRIGGDARGIVVSAPVMKPGPIMLRRARTPVRGSSAHAQRPVPDDTKDGARCPFPIYPT